MTRPALIGAGLGVLLLAAVGAALWLTGRVPEQATPVASPTVRTPHAPAQPVPAAPAALPAQIRTATPSPEQQARRKRLADLRAQFNALRAQGPAASPEKMRAVIDELETLAPAGLDHQYFQTLRELLDISAKVQKLSQELQKVAQSNTPQDAARRDAILKEIQALGKQATQQSQTLQGYAAVLTPKAKSP